MRLCEIVIIRRHNRSQLFVNDSGGCHLRVGAACGRLTGEQHIGFVRNELMQSVALDAIGEHETLLAHLIDTEVRSDSGSGQILIAVFALPHFLHRNAVKADRALDQRVVDGGSVGRGRGCGGRRVRHDDAVALVFQCCLRCGNVWSGRN